MTRPGYVDRNRLQSWADTRPSQSEFPRLIRRLILETTPGLVELGMPAGDGVAAGGWDGAVRSTKATAWVPDGLSVWELSVNSSPNTKADDDYSKRLDTPNGTPPADSTYVEAILRPWTARAAWVKEKRGDKVWKDIMALGLDDIETWLEAAPITWAWLSEELGLSPYGLRTGLTWWRGWAAQTNPALTHGVVLAGRTDAATALVDRFAHSGSVTTVAGASMDEVCAFIAAVAVDLEERGKGQMLARLAFVDDISTWRQLTASSQPLVLVPRAPDLANEIPVGAGHIFYVPVLSNDGADVTLPALDAAEVASALKRAGVADNEKAEALGRLGRRSLTGLRRNLAVKAALHRPTWADANPSRHFRSILLAGSWNDDSAGDREVLEVLSGADYETFREAITGVADGATDPLAIRTDGAWHLVSAVDAWMLLVSKLNHDDIKRFETIVEMTLGERDPALDLPRDQQWRASMEGKTRRFSNDLRRGIAQSLALLGMYGGTVNWSGGASGSDYANYLVRKLLDWASTDVSGKAWQSLADVLPLLAEAGPDAFLDAVATATAGNDPLLATMFQDTTDESGLFSGGTPHSNLLWALECVSWSTDFFGRAVDILARLDEIDPGGRMSNRPSATLAAIFRPWHPDSSVDADRRITVLDMLRRRHPDSAWKLECSMLPESHGTHFPISSPKFRTWKPDKLTVTYGEIWKVTTAVVERCIEDAGRDAERWATIIAHCSDMQPADRERVVTVLDSMADQPDPESDFRDSVWRSLTGLIGRHREFPDASWTLPNDELEKLDMLATRYLPSSAYFRLVGLFQSWHPYIGASRQGDYEAFERELASHRVEAIKEIESEGGFDAIRTLAINASVHGSVGIALANVGSSHDVDLLGWLSSDRESLIGTAMSYYSARYAADGFELITGLLGREGLTVEQRVRLLLIARENLSEVWEMAAAAPELEGKYWAAFHPLGLGRDFDRIEEVADRLLRASRHADVLYFLNMYSHFEKGEPRPATAKLIVRALDGLLEDQEQSTAVRGLATWDFERLFAYLEAMRDHLKPGELVRLQWSYLPALGYDAKIPALSQALAADPVEFVRIVCTVYRARTNSEDEDANDDKDPLGQDERDASMASNAYHVLNAWDTPPGLVDGVMNAEALRAWLEQAMELLADQGRTEVGLHHVGQVLGHTPPDADGSWPGLVVRDLLEEVQLDHIETGLYLQIVNGRGVTSRGLEDGGHQERTLAATYRDSAEALADVAPRVAGLFRRVAVSYEGDARLNEGNAERFRRGLH